MIKKINKFIDKVNEFIILKKYIPVSKKTIIKIIDIIFWGIVCACVIGEFKNKYNPELLNSFECFVNGILECIGLVIIYLPTRIALAYAYRNTLSEIDLKNDNYYREIIDIYSPGVLDYIDDFEIGNNTLTAILMGLELKGIINESWQIIKTDFSELDENEKYICTNIDKLKYIKIENLKNAIVQDCKKHNLLKEYKQEKAKNNSTILILLLWVGVAVISFVLAKIHIMLFVGLMIALGISIMVYVIYNVVFGVVDSTNQFTRAKKSEEINERLEGLRKYLQDYSSIEDKSQEELMLWEDYLIYSVIFNQNKKIIKEYQEKIDRM